MTTEEEIDLYAGEAVEAFRSLVPAQQDDGVLRAIIRDKMACVVGHAVAREVAEQRGIGAIVVENIFQAIRDEWEACAKIADERREQAWNQNTPDVKDFTLRAMYCGEQSASIDIRGAIRARSKE